MLLAPTAAAGGVGWSIGPTPDWVEPIEPFSAAPSPKVETERPRGIDERLFERQIDLRGTDTASWYATERAFLNRGGVADHTRYEITFDPLYQSVILHEMALLRDGKRLERIEGLDIRVLDTEPERALYHGRRTLSLLIEDVRVGDVLRVAFTRAGINPILAGLREHSFGTDRSWKTEGRVRLRVLADADRPLHVRTQGPAPEPVETVSDGVRTLVADQAFAPARPFPDSVPPRARDHGRIVVSDVADWQRVADWARPLYALDGAVPAELSAVADEISGRHEDRAARIGAALRWVQEEIRYFAVSLGVDSHRPATPAQTLARRFGDCKGKTLLLIALLEQLGIEAHAALVDTEGEIEAPDHPYRLHAFDHVIVRVVQEGVSHWLDPTLRHARGALGDLFEPDYGAALVLAPGVGALEPMRAELEAAPTITETRLEVARDPGTPVTVEIRTHLPAAHARTVRRRIERRGLRELDDAYLDYHDDKLGGIDRLSPLERHERDDGGLELVERYAATLWEGDGTEARRRRLDFAELDDELAFVPEEHPDGAAFRIAPTRAHTERWMITTARRIDVRDAEQDHQTPWFGLRQTADVAEDGTGALITAHYQPYVDEVAAEDLDAYRAAVRKAYRATRFTLLDRPPPGPLERLTGGVLSRIEIEPGAVQFGVLGAAFGVFGVASVRRRRARRGRVPDADPAAAGAGSDRGVPGPDPDVRIVSTEYFLSATLVRRAAYRHHLTLAGSLVFPTLVACLPIVLYGAHDYSKNGDTRFLQAWAPLLGLVVAVWALYGIGTVRHVERIARSLQEGDVRYRFELDARRFRERGSDGSDVTLDLATLHDLYVRPEWAVLQEQGSRFHVLPREAFASETDWERAVGLIEAHIERRAELRLTCNAWRAREPVRRHARGAQGGWSGEGVSAVRS